MPSKKKVQATKRSVKKRPKSVKKSAVAKKTARKAAKKVATILSYRRGASGGVYIVTSKGVIVRNHHLAPASSASSLSKALGLTPARRRDILESISRLSRQGKLWRSS